MDEIQKAMQAALQRAVDRRAGDEADVQRDARTLRIELEAAEGPHWVGDVVVLMRPAPLSSYDRRWSAAFGLDGGTSAGPPAARPRPVAVDVGEASTFGYSQVRDFGTALLGAVREAGPTAARIGLALPGAAHGLDEAACVEHLLLGLVDGLAAELTTSPLRGIALLEPNEGRRALIAEELSQLLGEGDHAAARPRAPLAWSLVYFPSSPGTVRLPAPFEHRLTYKETLTAFVAMPFASEMLDVFQYGIQGPARKARFKAERLDFEHFTGSVVDQIKDRIQRSHVVIADMSGSNPNVFLEIGYAWGRGRPTVLLWRRPSGPDAPRMRPPFDVDGASRIEYSTIGELDKNLTEKLRALYPELAKRAMSSP